MARGEPINRGALSGWVNWAQSEGLSQRGSMARLREAGLGINDAVHRQVWHEVADTRSKAGALADLGGNMIVPDDLHTTVEGGREGGYVYTLRTTIRDTDTNEVTSQWYSVAADDPMTVDQILSQADAEMTDALETDTGEGQQLLGSVLVAAKTFTGNR